MSEPLRIFVSHSHQDDAFARGLVAALRGAGADVWYDEHNMSSGRLGPVIERELRIRPVLVLVLSLAALASPWVEDECRWAYGRLRRDPTRTILPVLAAPIADEDAIWLFLQDFKRVEAPGFQPYSPAEAIRRTVLALALTPPGERPAPAGPQPTESAADLVMRGKALQSQDKHAEALPLFERATQLDPTSFDAWISLGYTMDKMKRPATEQLAAYECAIALSPNDAMAWTNKACILDDLQRFEEALAAHERAITLDPNDAVIWYNKASTLGDLERYDEALAACERAITLDPTSALAWYNKGDVLISLQRNDEALVAAERAIALDPACTPAWRDKGAALANLQRNEDALAAFEQATALDPTNVRGWTNTAIVLRALGRSSEADAAEARARALGA